MIGYRRFLSFSTEEDTRVEIETSPPAKAAKLAKAGRGTTVRSTCPRSESALVHVPALDREIWIACDTAEADRLRKELTAESDDRPVVIADDIVKLANLPREGLLAALRALCAFPGARAERLPDLPEGATGAIYFELFDGTLIREYVFGATAAKPESAEPLVAATEPVGWSGDAAELSAWFARALAAAQLPTEPFQLEPGRRIADPAKWYGTLCHDVTAGARGPRAGALLKELRRLREIIEAEKRNVNGTRVLIHDWRKL